MCLINIGWQFSLNPRLINLTRYFSNLCIREMRTFLLYPLSLSYECRCILIDILSLFTPAGYSSRFCPVARSDRWGTMTPQWTAWVPPQAQKSVSRARPPPPPSPSPPATVNVTSNVTGFKRANRRTVRDNLTTTTKL